LIRCAILRGTSVPDTSHASGPLDTFLHEREKALLGPRAVPKRRADFARGRWIAKRLIEACLPETRSPSIAILPDSEGVPWAYDETSRLPVSVSISHCAGYAAAALVASPARVGVDIETMISAPHTIVGEYFTESEQTLCAREGEREFAVRATLVWTLKEAALKVLGVGLRLPSTAVEVSDLAGGAVQQK